MKPPRVLVLGAHVPFVRGGAEFLVDDLTAELNRRGFQAEVVQIPFQWITKPDLLRSCLAWRLVDVTATAERAVDLVIATKFPTYVARHENKVTYLLHQHRAVYDLYGETAHSDFHLSAANEQYRERIIEMDSRVLPESRRIFTNAANTSRRLLRFNGIKSEVLHHPPHNADRFHFAAQGDFILSLGRLSPIKRLDLLLRALAAEPSLRAVIAGTGEDELRLKSLAHELALGERITFAGRVDDETAIDLYARCGAVYYAPLDEDFGVGPLEAGLASKPVVTATDSGGPLEFVEDGVTGRVVEPEAAAMAAALAAVLSPQLGRRLGEAMGDRARAITWDRVVERVTSTLPNRPWP